MIADPFSRNQATTILQEDFQGRVSIEDRETFGGELKFGSVLEVQRPNDIRSGVSLFLPGYRLQSKFPQLPWTVVLWL